MEILSTGEKIKRARIYNGVTLKELCDDKISISKMSCIENGKVKADSEIIRYVADKIGVDFDYLIEDVYEQIVNNLNSIKKITKKDYSFEENVEHNLEYAVEYGYFDLAFELMHILFTYYLEEKKWDAIQLIISQYYDLYQKTQSKETIVTYFTDMGEYLFKNKECTEAIAYYSRLREIFSKEGIDDKSTYAFIVYKEGICYLKLNNNENAYKLLSESIKNIEYINDNITKGKIYHSYALVCIKLKYNEAKEYIEKTFQCQKDDSVLVATSKGNYGEAYFTVGNREEAMSEIEDGIRLFPKDKKEKYVEFLIQCINVLINNGEYKKAYELSNESLDLAIATNDMRLVEHAY